MVRLYNNKYCCCIVSSSICIFCCRLAGSTSNICPITEKHAEQRFTKTYFSLFPYLTINLIVGLHCITATRMNINWMKAEIISRRDFTGTQQNLVTSVIRIGSPLDFKWVYHSFCSICKISNAFTCFTHEQKDSPACIRVCYNNLQ